MIAGDRGLVGEPSVRPSSRVRDGEVSANDLRRAFAREFLGKRRGP